MGWQVHFRILQALRTDLPQPEPNMQGSRGQQARLAEDVGGRGRPHPPIQKGDKVIVKLERQQCFV